MPSYGSSTTSPDESVEEVLLTQRDIRTLGFLSTKKLNKLNSKQKAKYIKTINGTTDMGLRGAYKRFWDDPDKPILATIVFVATTPLWVIYLYHYNYVAQKFIDNNLEHLI